MVRVTAENIGKALAEHVKPNAKFMTDESNFYTFLNADNGVFYHVSREHLARYCDEFAFRYENRKASDGERAKMLVAKAEGKRLPYKQPG